MQKDPVFQHKRESRQRILSSFCSLVRFPSGSGNSSHITWMSQLYQSKTFKSNWLDCSYIWPCQIHCSLLFCSQVLTSVCIYIHLSIYSYIKNVSKYVIYNNNNERKSCSLVSPFTFIVLPQYGRCRRDVESRLSGMCLKTWHQLTSLELRHSHVSQWVHSLPWLTRLRPLGANLHHTQFCGRGVLGWTD